MNEETLTGKGGALKRARTSGWLESDSAEKIETYQNSTTDGTINKAHQDTSKNDEEWQDRQMLRNPSSQDDELPFQEGAPLKEKDTLANQDFSREIFMAIISEIQEPEDDPMGRVDLIDYNSSDYDEFLSDPEMDTTPIPRAEAENGPSYELPPSSPPSAMVTVQMGGDEDECKKIRNKKRRKLIPTL